MIDHSEPQEIARLLEAVLDIEVGPYNAEGWADYHYDGVICFCHDQDEYNVERKTWSDLLNDLEGVEEQLQRQLTLHPKVHHRLILEGVIEPAAKGLLIYRKSPGKNVFMADLRGERQQAYKSIRAWLRQVSKYWEVVQTATMAETAMVLSTYYQADQVEEDEHLTFRRMFKHLDWTVNEQAQRILGGSGKVAIGTVKADAIAKHFGTAIRAWRAPVEEWVKVPGIGRKLATDYLRGIGRGDV